MKKDKVFYLSEKEVIKLLIEFSMLILKDIIKK